MASEQEEIFLFRRFITETPETEAYHCAAIEKLQTLYPHKKIKATDGLSIEIETDSLYCDSGIETYELGMINNELPALKCLSSGDVITFRT